MIRQDVYEEIITKIQQRLCEKYENVVIPHSDEFERATVDVIKEAIDEWNGAQQEDFRLDIEVIYLGGKRFPDIVCHNKTNDEKIGIEVKFHKSNESWTTVGNSAFASTQEHNLAAIYVLFGNFGSCPPQFEIKLMNDCVCDISATHNPRYNINMNPSGEFFVAQLGISYDELRGLSQSQREIIVNSYMARKKYTELSHRDDKNLVRAQCFILFPEIFSHDRNRKYKRMGVWLFANNIFCRNVRDFISGNGKRKIDLIGDERLPKVFFKLYQSRHTLKSEIGEMHPSLLLRSWYDNIMEAPEIPTDPSERLLMWIDLVADEFGGADTIIDETGYRFKETIEKLLS